MAAAMEHRRQETEDTSTRRRRHGLCQCYCTPMPPQPQTHHHLLNHHQHNRQLLPRAYPQSPPWPAVEIRSPSSAHACSFGSRAWPCLLLRPQPFPCYSQAPPHHLPADCLVCHRHFLLCSFSRVICGQTEGFCALLLALRSRPPQLRPEQPCYLFAHVSATSP